MSRTQDLALARMRMLVARWQQPEAVGPAPRSASTGRDRGPDMNGDACRSEADQVADRRPGPPVPLQLLVGLVVVVVALGGWTLARSWPRTDPGALVPRGAPGDTYATDPSVSVLHPVDGGVPEQGDGAAVPAGAPSGVETTPSAAPMLIVHVAGEVRRPGLVVLPAGSRVGDAVEAAGGLRRNGSLGAANLARILADGERIEIGAESVTLSPAGGTSDSGVGGLASVPVDLNSATAEQLDVLPGVGPVTAAKILAWRAEHGRFTVVDELAEVPGIGPKTLEELRPHVRV